MKGKEVRILTLLAIDIAFFLIEITVGYAVHSLALVADSFHMLNDIFSLIVAWWAVKIAKSRGVDSKYTYGWRRAEILGALINGVFLVALCMSIFLEAVQRFLDPPVINNPQLILIVGCAGLVSNIIGMFLFHEHGHSHSHNSPSDFEQDHERIREATAAAIASIDSSRKSRNISAAVAADDGVIPTPDVVLAAHDDSTAVDERTGLLDSSVSGQTSSYCIQNGESSFRQEGQEGQDESRNRASSIVSDTHVRHFHSQPKTADSRSHKSLNMEGVFLHVLGDALGNIGVIATAVFIWKTDYSWRYYMDPVISLVITIIIFSSALPLCRRASSILLQGVPTSVNADEVKEDLVSLPGVEDIHELHIWLLSEDFYIATLHVSVSLDEEDFMTLAQKIRTCLYGHGIHSITIQPEFVQRGSISRRSSIKSGSITPRPCAGFGMKSSGGLAGGGQQQQQING